MRGLRRTIVILFASLFVVVTGVYATWKYSEEPAQSSSERVNVVMNEITFAPKETLHITAVELLSSSGAENVSVHFTHPTYLATTISTSRTGGNVTYKVTVWNNTGVTYWYLGPSFEQDFESNNLIGISNGITVTTKDNSDDTGSTFNNADWVPPYTTRDFYITYGFGSSAQGLYLSTLLMLEFGIKMDAVHDQFLAILNDRTSANGYHYLTEIFEQRYEETGSTVIANVGEDEEIFDNLFGGQLTINVDGEVKPVTMMIRRENVDGRTTGDNYDSGLTGCEYTLYITVDALDSPTGEAIVYAVSYSSGGVGITDGTWYQLGQLYEGTAPLESYGNGVAFDYTQWEATAKEYEFIGGKTYKVGYDQGDQYDKLKTIEQIMSANDQDVFNDIDNTGVLRKVYSIVYSSSNYNKPGYEGLRTAFESAAPFYDVYNGGQEVKVRRNATRAEILPYMIAIQHALDYYNQVNP
ncbi:MAG: hypothetical protein IJF44_02660 [Clostridia bacterium]|nr:hypothetical protein [Clostridia bacterium]MBQ3505345.1 hypothetical protein [Clostridia bacterium]